MSLLNLTTETMVTLTERLLDPKRLRKALTALPLILPLVPVLQRVHDDLISKQKTISAADREIAAIQAEESERDRRHDRKMRGTHSFLGALAEMTDDAATAQGLLDLRDRLVPAGPTATTRSYVDEAGDAQRLPARLDDASRKLLAKLHTPDGPLQVHVDAWVEEARQLGMLEERREHLTQQIAAGAAGPTAAEVVAARNGWIRAIRALETNLALEPKADAETVDKIMGPIQRAEAKADRRRGASKSNGATEPADTVDAAPAAGAGANGGAGTQGDAVAKAENAVAKGSASGGTAGTPDALAPAKVGKPA